MTTSFCSICQDSKFPSFSLAGIIFLLTVLLMLGCGEQQQDDEYTDAMAEEHQNDTPEANASWYEPTGDITTQNVAYYDDVQGFMAEPDGSEGQDLPGVILIHEWWGLNDNIRMMSRRLAEEGFRVLAVDLYEGEVAESSDQARELMQAAMQNPDNGLAHLQAAADFMNENTNGKVGLMGWCFGGAWTLNGAIAMSDKLDAGVIYYGRVNTNPEELDTINIPLLGIFGEEDGGIPVENVREFETQLSELGKNAEIHIYEGADHAFANPSGNRYEPEAAADAWDKTLGFLNETLK
ncbi:MAG: dienelactone hydrolase family protein [Cyclonatronaceae bacterium]